MYLFIYLFIFINNMAIVYVGLLAKGSAQLLIMFFFLLLLL